MLLDYGVKRAFLNEQDFHNVLWIKWWFGIRVEKEGGYPSRLLTTKSTIKNKIYDCDSVTKLAKNPGFYAMDQRLFFGLYRKSV